MIKQRLSPEFTLRREVCALEDGGTVSIDWAADSVTRALPPDAPIVIFLHTVTGSGKTTTDFLQYAASQGWRSCVFNRRGHDQKLTTARFNVIGTSLDTVSQMDVVKRTWPTARFVGMVGISAGSGHLVTYLGSEGEHCRVDAAVSLCPAYSLATAFETLASEYPVVDKYLLKGSQQCWLPDIPQLLQDERQEKGSDDDTVAREKALKSCWDARNFHEFLLASYPFAPRERGQQTAELQSVDEYMKLHNPMSWTDSVTVPILLLNAEDDLVCRKENIPLDVVTSLPLAALIITRYGSHVAYQESLWSTSPSYMHRITFEFLSAAMETGAATGLSSGKPEL